MSGLSSRRPENATATLLERPDTSVMLMIWDAYSAGRVARDERFAFLTLSGRTRISSKDIPRAVDGFDLSGEDFLR